MEKLGALPVVWQVVWLCLFHSISFCAHHLLSSVSAWHCQPWPFSSLSYPLVSDDYSCRHILVTEGSCLTTAVTWVLLFFFSRAHRLKPRSCENLLHSMSCRTCLQRFSIESYVCHWAASIPSRNVCHLRGCKKLLTYSNPSLVVPMGN